MTLSLLERAKKIKELNAVRAALTGGTLGLLERAKNIKALNALRLALGGGAMPAADTDVSGSLKTADWYAFDENRTKAQRQKDNNAVFALLDKLENGEMLPENLTAADKAVLAKYSGNGGGLVGRDGKRGSAHEYYTPAPVAAAMWDALQSMGFSGGKVLDPCAGTGVFGAVSPESAVMDAVEMDETSAAVNRYVNAADGYSVQNSPFEAVAANTPDETHDAVVTNVPFGANTARAHKNLDPKYRSQTLEGYFILRSLDKLKPSGLAAFVVPTSVVDGKGGKAAKLRLEASLKAEFLGAYRLPNKVFSAADTGADVVTDIVFFRKYGRDAAVKIAELQEQNPTVLNEAGVLWDVFLSGKYFQSSDGKRHIIGTQAQTTNRYGKAAMAVVSDDSVANIAKAVKPFGASRINWDLLDTAETAPIVYQDGDAVHQDGQTLLYQNGQFVPQDTAPDAAQQHAENVVRALASPYSAFEAQTTYAAADAARKNFIARSRANGLPHWANRLLVSVNGLSESKREAQFQAAVAALSVQQLLQENATDESLNYLEVYPELSAAMKRYARTAADKSLDKTVRDAWAGMKLHYSAKDGYSAVWRGERTAPVREFTAAQQIEAAQYRTGSLSLPLEEMRRINPDFDVMADDDWAVSADGLNVIRTDDLLVGNYAEAIAKLDADMAAAATPEIAAKIARTKALAAQRVKPVNVDKMRFDVRSPYLTADEVAAFLRTLEPSPRVVVKNEDGKRWADIENHKSESNIAKLQNRLGDHIKNGTLTLGNIKLENANGTEMSKEEGMAAFRALLNQTNAQLNTWVHANPQIMARLREQANNPANLYFEQAADESELAVAGINPEWQLHGYQADFVRRQSRLFGGINGFGTGLGKTFTALTVAQYAQNVGTKKKTLFVVPNAVFSNWYKEAAGNGSRAGVYDSDVLSRCLFVGADVGENGFNANSKNYARDLNRILENKHDKVFMTQEAFFKIRLKEETAQGYRAYLAAADKSFAESERNAENEKKESRFADIAALLTGSDSKQKKLANAPYFEDMGFDSIVIDEAHHFKNSKQTYRFGKQAKGLGNTSSASARGIDAMAKTWLVRGSNGRNDGVLCLSATPITNSPLEIYSMMSLAAGEERVNQAMLGAKGADDFMNLACQLQNRDDYNIIGEYVPQDMFVGLKNVELLRSLIGDVAVLKNAADVGMAVKLPGSEEISTEVVLSQSGKEKLEQMKAAYRAAREQVKADRLGTMAEIKPADWEALQATMLETGEPLQLIADPFNLISKMDALILDEELAQRATFYDVQEGSEEAAQAAMDAFNEKGYKEKQNKEPRHTLPEDILGKKFIRDDNGDVVKVEFTVRVQARLQNGRILLDSTDFATQQKFEALLEKHGAQTDVAVSPKMAALAVNVKNEQAHIRATDAQGNKLPDAKQIVFCDHLAAHNKIKRILAQKSGVPAAKITFVSGQFNSEADEILDVQEAFNADGDANRYCLVIANKKAEVGINLQKGTQAIHHLSIPWTPDGLTQRNGRGVRQGNANDFVNVYHYDATGTFDVYRRNVVEKKGDWIDELLDGGDSGGLVEVSGGLTNEQYDELIRLGDNAAEFEAMQQRIEAAQKSARIKHAKDAQLTNMSIFKRERKFQQDNENFEAYANTAWRSLKKALEEVKSAKERLQKSEDKGASENAIKRNQRLLEQARADLAEMQKRFDGAFESFRYTHWDTEKGSNVEVDGTLADYLQEAEQTYLQDPERTYAADSQLRGDWDKEMTISRNMQAAAEKAMLQDAQDVDGAFSADEIRGAMEKHFHVCPNGAMLFADMVADADGEVLVVNGNFRSIDLSAYTTDAVRPDSVSLDRLESTYADAVFVRTDTPEAVPALQKLAQREAALIDEYSGVVPEDKSLLKRFPQLTEYMPDVKIRFKLNEYAPMKPPYFVRCLSEDLLNTLDDRTPFEPLAAKQAFLNIETKGFGNVYGNGEIIVDDETLFDKARRVDLPMVVDSLKAHGIKAATVGDLAKLAGVNLFLIADFVADAAQVKQNIKQLEALADDAEKDWADVMAAVRTVFEDGLSPYCAQAFDDAFYTDLMKERALFKAIKERFDAAHYTPPEYVYLTGNTYHFSQKIGRGKGLRKVLEAQGLAAAFVPKDGNCRWDGDKALFKEAGSPSNVRNAWLISRKAWEFLQESYPNTLEEYNISASDAK